MPSQLSKRDLHWLLSLGTNSTRTSQGSLVKLCVCSSVTWDGSACGHRPRCLQLCCCSPCKLCQHLHCQAGWRTWQEHHLGPGFGRSTHGSSDMGCCPRLLLLLNMRLSAQRDTGFNATAHKQWSHIYVNTVEAGRGPWPFLGPGLQHAHPTKSHQQHLNSGGESASCESSQHGHPPAMNAQLVMPDTVLCSTSLVLALRPSSGLDDGNACLLTLSPGPCSLTSSWTPYKCLTRCLGRRWIPSNSCILHL